MQLHVSGRATLRNCVKLKNQSSTQQRVIEDPALGLSYKSPAHVLQGFARSHIILGFIEGFICFQASILD